MSNYSILKLVLLLTSFSTLGIADPCTSGTTFFYSSDVIRYGANDVWSFGSGQIGGTFRYYWRPRVTSTSKLNGTVLGSRSNVVTTASYGSEAVNEWHDAPHTVGTGLYTIDNVISYLPDPGCDSTNAVSDSRSLSVLRPYISGSQAIWWLGGGSDSANGYSNSSTLSANGNGAAGTANWTIVSGPVSTSCSSCGATTATSTGPSANCTYDVGIKISYSGFESNIFTMNVNRPRSLTAAYAPYGTAVSDQNNEDGYISRIGYISVDACGYAMSGIALNEQFGGWLYNNTTYDWNHPLACYDPATGSTTCTSGYGGYVWQDSISQKLCASCSPVVKNPQSPLLDVRVDYATQYWRIGSSTIGSGVQVQTNTLQRYQDHGRHESINSPVNP